MHILVLYVLVDVPSLGLLNLVRLSFLVVMGNTCH